MSGSQGLSIQDIATVTVSLAPTAVGLQNFGAVMIVGSSDVIDVVQRQRQYSTISQVIADFGTNTPEYFAALLFFEQAPQPALLFIGRWAQTATAALLRSQVFAAGAQATLIATLTTVSNGNLSVTVDGVAVNMTSLAFTGVTTMSGIAAIVNTALSTHGSCVWNPGLGVFTIESATTGGSSTMSYGTPTGGGTSLAAVMGFNSSLASALLTPGIAAESAITAITNLAAKFNNWYMYSFACATAPVTADYLAMAAFTEAAFPTRLQGITTQDANTIASGNQTSLAYQLNQLGYSRTMIVYSSSNAYAVLSAMGRLATVNYAGVNTTITLKFKQEPGVAPEIFTETQAAAADAVKCNYYAAFSTGFQIVQQGVMCNGFFIDERIIMDAWQNAAQVAVVNVLLLSPTKVPQTDPGIHLFIVALDAVCEQFVTNGALAPGVWTSNLQFGSLVTGDTLAKGYYGYAQPVAQQNLTDRGNRKAPPIQYALKFAGAVHFANVSGNFVR